jgi:hypothetical protein
MAYRGEYQVKKNSWGALNQLWVEPDVRDNVVETMEEYRARTEITLWRLLKYACMSRSEYYEWKHRYGLLNRHNGKLPKENWLFSDEEKAIIEYAKIKPEEGYRRLAYRIIDDDVVYATPSSVYRVLKVEGAFV